jgi:SWI/SNF-related matrix-associated actin-dependent regulator 1 of chromatin subfamily A
MAVVLVHDGKRYVAKTDGPQDRFGPKNAGFRWDPDEKVWWTKYDDNALKLRDVADEPTKAKLEGIAAERTAALEASRATDAEIDVPCPEGLEYKPFQRAGIAYAMAHPNVLFGDEMGLGKTIEAIAVFNADPSISRVLVICPASLRINWKREFEKWATRPITTEILTTKHTELPEASVVIVNYDILKKLRDILRAIEWDYLVADEAHYMKNSKAGRTREVLGYNKRDKKTGKWVKDPAPIAAKRFAFLTGTPITNRPIEGWTLLHKLAPETFKNWKYYTSRYCAAYNDGWGMDVSGASNLEELQDKARSSCMIRRKKADVLKELPPKQRQVIEMPANGCAKVIKAEREAWLAQEQALQELRVRVELSKASEDPEEYAEAVRKLRQAVAVAFTEMARVRHETAVAKAPMVVEHVRDALEANGAKVVVFAHHKDVVEILREGLDEFGTAIVTGDTSMKVDKETGISPRQAEVDRFQEDPKTRAFIGNIQAAGVGITLTASSHVVFAELDWVPGNMSQAEDRCHRIGQHDSVLVQHLVLEDSLDARMANTLVEKQAVLDRALDVKTDGTGAVPEVVEVPVLPVAEKSATENAKRDALGKEAEKLTPDNIAAIHEALRMVAGMCDGARAKDDMGFSAVDVEIGHSLASVGTLSPRQAALGRKVVWKYQRQYPEAILQAMGSWKKEEK